MNQHRAALVIALTATQGLHVPAPRWYWPDESYKYIKPDTAKKRRHKRLTRKG